MIDGCMDDRWIILRTSCNFFKDHEMVWNVFLLKVVILVEYVRHNLHVVLSLLAHQPGLSP